MKQLLHNDESVVQGKNPNSFSFRRLPWLEIALVVSLVWLTFLIFEQELTRWWQFPSPGKVGVDWLDEDFLGNCISQSFLIGLPADYYDKTDWPLLVLLHGSAKRGSNPQDLCKLNYLFSDNPVNELPAVRVFPQCRPQRRWQADDLRKFVERIGEKFRVDADRIYLVGYSMGGYGTWSAAAEHPDLFAAIAPIAGGGSVDTADRLERVPTWVFHGRKDKVVPSDQTTNLVAAVKLAGGDPKLTLYPEEGHGIYRRVSNTPELWHWLFEQNLRNRPQMEPISPNSNTEQKNTL